MRIPLKPSNLHPRNSPHAPARPLLGPHSPKLATTHLSQERHMGWALLAVTHTKLLAFFMYIVVTNWSAKLIKLVKGKISTWFFTPRKGPTWLPWHLTATLSSSLFRHTLQNFLLKNDSPLHVWDAGFCGVKGNWWVTTVPPRLEVSSPIECISSLLLSTIGYWSFVWLVLGKL